MSSTHTVSARVSEFLEDARAVKAQLLDRRISCMFSLFCVFCGHEAHQSAEKFICFWFTRHSFCGSNSQKLDLTSTEEQKFLCVKITYRIICFHSSPMARLNFEGPSHNWVPPYFTLETAFGKRTREFHWQLMDDFGNNDEPPCHTFNSLRKII